MRSEEYWQELREISAGKRAHWQGHQYIAERRCICGEVDCPMQGLCHCGCGEQVPLSTRQQSRKGVVLPVGLPIKALSEHNRRGITRKKGIVTKKVQEEKERYLAERRCLCGEIDCQYQGLCHCGCGAVPPLSKQAFVSKTGERIAFGGMPMRFLKEHIPAMQGGEKSLRFVGFRAKHGKYWRVWAPDHPRTQNGRIAEHIWIIEQELGRYLHYYGKNHKDNEVVHHKDLNKDNNARENLELMTHGEHSALHHALRREARKKSKVIRRKRCETL